MNRHKWGALGPIGAGALKAAGGGLATTTGVGLCSTVAGCAAGAPIAAIGASDTIQGTTMVWDALHGQASEGYNPLKNLAEAANPEWGGFAYDAASIAATTSGFAQSSAGLHEAAKACEVPEERPRIMAVAEILKCIATHV